MSISAYPKIFHLGDKHIKSIWDEEVEVTEKLDGSQFVFGLRDGNLFIRSKGKMIYDTDHYVRDVPSSDLFYKAVNYIISLPKIPWTRWSAYNDIVFYGETLTKPKHSTLAYERVPKNNIALFAVEVDGVFLSYKQIQTAAGRLAVEAVPLLYHGMAPTDHQERIDWIHQLVNTESVLGKAKAEGIVVKNYKEYFVGGELLPLMSGKFVTEQFKEVNKYWHKKNTGKGKWETYKKGFRTEARWNKAVQFLKENGDLEGAPRDIGALIKRIQADITEEEKENIKNVLWAEMGKDVLRVAIVGFPEWYKDRLLESNI